MKFQSAAEHLKKAHLLLHLLALLLRHQGTLLPFDQTAFISQLSLTNLYESKSWGPRKLIDSHLFPRNADLLGHSLAFLCWDCLAFLHRHL